MPLSLISIRMTARLALVRSPRDLKNALKTKTSGGGFTIEKHLRTQGPGVHLPKTRRSVHGCGYCRVRVRTFFIVPTQAAKGVCQTVRLFGSLTIGEPDLALHLMSYEFHF